jgi:hypothetical protein
VRGRAAEGGRGVAHTPISNWSWAIGSSGSKCTLKRITMFPASRYNLAGSIE